MNESPDVPVSVPDKALHVGADVELYHSTETPTPLGPVYVTVAVRAEADCPTSYKSGPVGATLTVGSA